MLPSCALFLSRSFRRNNLLFLGRLLYSPFPPPAGRIDQPGHYRETGHRHGSIEIELRRMSGRGVPGLVRKNPLAVLFSKYGRVPVGSPSDTAVVSRDACVQEKKGLAEVTWITGLLSLPFESELSSSSLRLTVDISLRKLEETRV